MEMYFLPKIAILTGSARFERFLLSYIEINGNRVKTVDGKLVPSVQIER